jgi:hypothetical protein
MKNNQQPTEWNIWDWLLGGGSQTSAGGKG